MNDKLDITSNLVRAGLAGLRDQLWQPQYSSIEFGDAESMIGEFQFFSQGGGLLSETNQSQGSQVSSAVSLLIRGHALRCSFQDVGGSMGDGTADAELMALILQYSSVEWIVTEKAFLKCPSIYVSGNIKVRGVDDFFQHLGDEACMPLMYDAKVVVPIASEQSYSVDWNIYSPGAGSAEETRLQGGLTTADQMRFTYYMLAYRRRPVQ